MAEIRLLSPQDQDALGAFLHAHTAEAMILRSNLAQSGVTDGPEPYNGRYVAAFENQRVVAAAAHYWNNMLILCAPAHAAEVARTVSQGRHIAGILGPWKQALEAQDALEIGGRDTLLRARETLMTLQLGSLRYPEALSHQRLHFRLAEMADIDLLTEWREAFRRATMGATQSEALRRQCRAEMVRWVSEESQFLLFDGDHPVSGCAYNARLPDAVQIGNVFTPPQFRSRGYARFVVAGALDYARRDGTSMAVLFTPESNAAALAAYAALGFTAVGQYAMLLYK